MANTGVKGNMDAQEQFYSSGVIPTVVIAAVKDALPTADAIIAGGIRVVEVMLRTSSSLDVIRTLSMERPQMLVGAGTVTTLEHCKKGIEAGAQFIVSPGLNKDIVNWCMKMKVNVIPGCVTPTEIMEAISLGCKVLKYFPASIFGGIKALRALSNLFDSVRFVPTGGIDGESLAAYLAMPFVLAAGGSWVCPAELINTGQFEKITQLCAEAVACVVANRR